MKYIRTKDRIYEDKYVHIKVDKDGYAIMEYKGDFYEAPEKVKIADTIEELCDEFVFDGIVWDKLEDVMFCLDKEDYTKIYGAIWTDKGLIYVAKMNEKGDLELI